jgi:hypothetical protein
LFGDFRLEIDEDEIFRDDDPLNDLVDMDPVPSWPAELRLRLPFYDQERRQSSILKANDRLLRTLFHHDARWLLTGVDPLETRLLTGHGRTVLGEFDQQLRSYAKKPHPEPWLLAPDPARLASEADLARVAEKEARLARLKALGGSAIAAYQALELHREAEDPQEGKLVIVPGHGWNARSLWEDADDVVNRLLDALKDGGR